MKSHRYYLGFNLVRRIQNSIRIALALGFVLAANQVFAQGPSLVYSFAADRSSPALLDQASFDPPRDIHVFVDVPSGQGISWVRFYLNGSLSRSESAHPYDFAGGSVDLANPLDPESLSVGTHTISTTVHYSDGTEVSSSASFYIGDSEVPSGQLQTLDFEGFALGQIIDDEYAASLGVNISTVNLAGGPNHSVIFDSNAPTGGDFDLGAPFSATETNPNLGSVSPGNLLIIHEDHTCDAYFCTEPNDEGNNPAGVITFEFNEPTFIVSLDIFDLDLYTYNSRIDFYNVSGNLLATVPVPQTGDTRWDRLEIDQWDVKRMELHVGGSAAFDNLQFVDLANGENQAPQAQDIQTQTQENTPANITLSGTDPDGNALTFSIVNAPQNGQISGNLPNIIYTPNNQYFGQDSFTYIANDGLLNSEPAATVTVTVLEVNESPQITSSPVTSVTLPNGYSYDVEATDPDGDSPLIYSLISAPAGMQIDANSGLINWSPTESDIGDHNVSVQVADPYSASDQQDFIVSVYPIPNETPIANDLSVQLDEDTQVLITLQGSDGDNDPITYNIVANPSQGELTGSGNTYTYVPNTNFYGQDSFTYTVSDALSTSQTATVTITVNEISTAPQIIPPPVTVGYEGTPYSYSVQATDSDANDSLAHSLISAPDGIAIDGNTGEISWVNPALEFVGSVNELNDQCYVVPDGFVTISEELGNESDLVIEKKLFSETKEALEKAVSYVSEGTILWTENSNHRCLGCHTQSQSAFGLGSAIGKVDINLRDATSILNYINNASQSNGSLKDSHDGWAVQETILNLWGLSTWPDKEYNYFVKYSASNFLVENRNGDIENTFWEDDLPGSDPWWERPIQLTSLAVLGLVDTVVSAKELSQDYEVPRFITESNSLSGSITDIEVGPDGTVYLLNSSGQIDRFDPVTGTTSMVLGGLPQNLVGLAVRDNGNFVVSGDQTLLELSLDGAQQPFLSTLTAFKDVDIGPDGFVYVADYNNRKIQIWDQPGQLISEIISTDDFLGIYSLTFDSVGNLYTANSLGRDISIVYPDGAVQDYARLNFDPSWIDIHEGGGMYISVLSKYKSSDGGFTTPPGMLYIDTEKRSVRVSPGNSYSGIVSHSSGLLTFNQTLGALQSLSFEDLDISNIPVFQAEISKAANWLISQSIEQNSENEDLATALLGLTKTRSIDLNPQLMSDVSQKIELLKTTLLQRQNSDGGWGRFDNDLSDPLITSLVGLAIISDEDDLNSPLMRATEYLLDTQASDGSWTKVNNTLTTKLSVTSLAMAFLPYALEAISNPDLSVVGLELTQGSEPKLNARILNRGIASVADTVNVNFYNGSTDNAPLLGVVSLDSVAYASESIVSLSLQNADILGSEIFVEIETSSSIEECEIRNNKRLFAVVKHQVTDSRQLSDTQTYILNVEDVNSGPVIDSPTEITHQQAQTKGQKISASDSDIGDALSYSISGAPEGVSIDERNGQLYTDPDLIVPGQYTFTVQVEDLRGATDQQEIMLTVEANLPPEIVSMPVEQVLEGDFYEYPVQAVDPNSDELRFEAEATQQSIQINSRTGHIDGTFNQPIEGVREKNQLCLKQTESLSSFSMVEKWSWTTSESEFQKTFRQVMMAPVVGQLNDDNGDGQINLEDTPDIVFKTYEGSSYQGKALLRAISGADGSEIWDQVAIWSRTATSPALADIDNDGIIEIITDEYYSNGDRTFIALEHDGQLKWRVPASTGGMPSIADLDNDGIPEIIYGPAVYNNLGQEIWRSTAVTAGAYGLALDVDLDGDLEVYINGALHEHDGTLIWHTSTAGIASVGNFDDDGFPEFAVIGNQQIRLLDHDGSVIWGPVYVPGGGGGALTVSDVDGDGEPEIGVAGANNYAVFESNGALKWAQPIEDDSSKTTGSTVFDFEGDGTSEILYADEHDFRIYDGITGDILVEVDNPSGTIREYPLVVDIDNDSHAEIVLVANNMWWGDENGIRVFEGLPEWAPTRSIWNQYQYHVNNINEDGTVPQYQEPSWLSHNTFRLNTFPDRDPLSQPDLAPFELSYNDTTQTLSAVILNRGLAPTNGDATVTFYSGDPDNGGIILGSQTLGSINAEESITVSINAIAPELLLDEVTVDIQYAGSIEECIIQNNRTKATVVKVTVQDEGGLTDSQTYLFSVINQNDAPEISSSASSVIESSEALSIQVSVNDPDLGDAHTFTLDGEPDQIAGLSINEKTGEITADPFTLTAGIRSFEIIATDLGGLSAQQGYVLNITQAGNTPPQVTSTPVENVNALDDYFYAVTAEDIDGDAFAFVLAQKPQGMQIDGVTGEITWQPEYSQIGVHAISVTVLDERGASSSHNFNIVVADPYAGNLPPQITSEPSGTLSAGKRFAYQVIATDPDGDALTYYLEEASSRGMHIDEDGLFTWMPQIESIGIFETVDILVSDGRNGFAKQSLVLPVSEPANNPPRITSAPPLSVEPGGDYQYQVIAEDIDGDDFSLLLQKRANGMVMSDSGLITWTPSSDQQTQTFEIEITAIDERGASYTQFYTVAVGQYVEPNELPYFTSQPLSPAIVGQVYDYQAVAVDPDGDAITYQLYSEQLPGMDFNSATGLFTWLPVEGQEGQYSISILASDGKGASIQTFTLNVDPVQDLSNAYPEVSSTPSSEVVLGEQYTYTIFASDPDGTTPTYELINAPAGMAVSAEGVVQWTPTIDDLGIQDISVKISDGQLNLVQNWSIKVWSDAPPLKLFLEVAPNSVEPGQTVIVATDTFGGIVPADVTLYIDDVETPLDAFGTATITASGFGLHQVRAVANSGSESVEALDEFLVVDVSDTTAPIADIQLPIDVAELSAPTAIIGTASDDNLVKYELFYRAKNSSQWALFAEGNTSILSDELATFDTSLIMNGQYSILLRVTDVNGQTAEDSISVIVEGDLKVGNFSFTVEDLNIPMAGIPIQVTRTYDSRQRAQNLDFGYGWSVDYQNVKLEESRRIGLGWQIITEKYAGGLLANYCVRPLGSPIVTVTLPNGDVEKFKAVAEKPCWTMQIVRFIDVVFEPMSGTNSKLEIFGDNSAYLNGSNVGDTYGTTAIIDPDKYKLTTQAGYEYYIDQNFGITKVIDPHGYTITYTDDGIFHSNGKSIEFVRDSNGQITEIIDPQGAKLVYERDLAGDLVGVTDRDNVKVSTYEYNNSHGLTVIKDAYEVSIVTNHYDDDGRLYAQEDANGIITEFDHDLDANSSTVTDRDGRIKTFIYNDMGYVEEEIIIINDGSYATNIVTTYDHDALGNELIKTIGESTWENDFDEKGNQLFARDPENHTVYYRDYNERGQEETIEDEMGRIHTMEYDDFGSLTNVFAPEVTDPDTLLTTIYEAETELDNNGLPKFTIDMSGFDTHYTYYESGPNKGQKRTEFNLISGTVTYTYDDNNNVKSETRQRAVDGTVIEETIEYDYDNRDRLIKTTYPDNSYTETRYDITGTVDKERDRFGRWTDYTYDPYGRLTNTLYSEGTREIREYTNEGLLLRVTDRSGKITRNEYDNAGRLWKVHNETTGTFKETRYTLQGWVQYEWDEKRNLTEYVYDKAGKRKKVIRHFEDDAGNALTQEHSFDYYDNGELKSETDHLLRTTTYIINELDQRIETQYHDGSVMKERYDAMGRRIATIDQNDVRTQFRLDASGRLEGVTPQVTINGEAVPETTYTYDEQGNKLTQTDAKGHTTSWTYDYFGRVLTRTLPEQQVEYFSYSKQLCNDQPANIPEGEPPAYCEVVTHTDFNGDTITTVSDNMGRADTVSYSKDGRYEEYTYWPNDQLKTVTVTSNGTIETTEYFYDGNHRLSYEVRPNNVRMDYDYDAAGNRTLVKVTRNGTVSSETAYRYDGLNRLKRVINNPELDINGDIIGGEESIYTYDGVGNLDTVTYPNGLVTDYDYNDLNQLTDVYTRDANNNLLSHYNYGLDATGRRQTISELDGRLTAYCYDEMYRLKQETIFDSSQIITDSCLSEAERTAASYKADYVYDWVGNRTYETVDGVQTAYTYDDNDRLEQSGGTIYSYDDNGNTLTETLDGNVTTYTYDGRNKLISVEKGGATTEFAYNHSGIRTSKTGAGNTTLFIVDENRDYAQVLEEVVAGAVQVKYVYGHDLISQERAANDSFYHYDGLGSTRKLSDANGTITDEYFYYAFGQEDEDSRVGSTENSYKFTGEQFDSSLSQYYLRARFYDQGIGRFTQMDTWAGRNFDPASLHKYTYVKNEPAWLVDPSGNVFAFSIGARLSGIGVSIATAYPRATLIAQTVASIATPIELAALSPVSAALAVGGTATYTAVKHLDKAAELAASAQWVDRLKSGVEFEKFIGKLISQGSNSRAILNGAFVKGRPAGSAVPDFFFKGGVLEAKLTGSAVKETQIKEFAKFVGDGGNVTYVFAKKPPASVIQDMEKWIKQTKKQVNLQIAYLIE